MRKSLEIDPDNADAAEQRSLFKQTNPASRIRRKMAAMAAELMRSGQGAASAKSPADPGALLVQ